MAKVFATQDKCLFLKCVILKAVLHFARDVRYFAFLCMQFLNCV